MKCLGGSQYVFASQDSHLIEAETTFMSDKSSKHSRCGYPGSVIFSALRRPTYTYTLLDPFSSLRFTLEHIGHY